MNPAEVLNPAGDPLQDGIAIIGMAGQFPGAADVQTFWTNLLAGKDSITCFSMDELEARNADAGESEDYVTARGILDDVEMFDADYFGIPPKEAERMDPQHRLFLEACSNALEDAGYVSGDYPGEIGLFAGCSLNTYLLANLAADRATLDELTGQYQVGEFQVALGNDKDFLTTRAAYKLNLRGPVVSVQSACATSLVAICQAAQSLMNYACDMALAGGVSATFPQHRGHVYQEGGIVSRDGRCRPFDADATGTVFGHGVGVVVLKRLDEALRDGDHIAAVIRGFAVNNDGSAKAGYMAPGVDGQARVIAAAQAMAGVSPRTISYVEAHGTGTPLGDPIEIAALTKAFRAGTQAEQFCAVGTAKGNVGHLDAAAGVTGLIKATLSLQHRTLPALQHFKHVNPHIDLAGSPFVFHGENTAWTGEGPLRAGVSAFGVGGVNAHVVLEEAPAIDPGSPSPRSREILCVSGRSQAEALQAAARLAAHLETAKYDALADVAFTLAAGRKAHAFRVAVTAADAAEAALKLRALQHVEPAGAKRLGLLFSGQGTQFSGMGRELYQAQPVYRDVVDACAEQARALLGCDLREVMFDSHHAEQSQQIALEQTSLAQPALFITELALASLWQSFGVEPEAMLGHSLGEYVAATLASVWTRPQALRLVCRRGQLMQSMAPGAMLSVALTEAELLALPAQADAGAVQLAAVNGPRSGVLAGTFAGIAQVEAVLADRNIASRRLRTSHAFHSAMMQPMLAEFGAEVAFSAPRAPQTPLVSSVTGTWMTDEQAQDANYWAEQCVRPVRFAAGLATLRDAGIDLLLETGPGETLTTLALQAARAEARVQAMPSFTRGSSTRNARTLEEAAASLWCAGVPLDWSAYFAGQRRLRVSLPTYPFNRKKHWIEPPARSPSPKASNAEPLASASLPLSVPTAVPQGSIPLMNSAPTQSTVAAIEAMPSRNQRLREAIAAVFADLSGIETTPAEAEHAFLELGFDSLFLTQATSALSKKFGVKLTFRQMMEEFSSVAALAAHLDAVLAADAFAVPVMAPTPVPSATPALLPATPVERLLTDQLAALSKLFSDQVQALHAAAGQAAPPASAPAQRKPPPAENAGNPPAGDAPTEVRMLRPVHAKAFAELTPAQNEYIAGLIARYTAMTPGSKQATQTGRARLADPRAVAGFRPQWKEMVYPLLVERARGARLWDVDGNEFIDIVNGYGCILFGHSPDFVVQAASAQLEKGVAIGPQSPLAAEVAALLCELTGNERVTFCNTGSEAVMAAIRVARTITGRDKFVYFAGDYHGTFDEVLVRSTPRGSAPVAPGIPLANTANVVVLEYGAQASLDYLRTHAEDIAAVLIEPVQTRNPALQPFDFIRDVRRITEETGSAMILDEVVTGFRLAPGGVQQMLGLRADMCTYGKVIGGGHPIGVLSGKSMYLDALDGGAWQFGDDSGPEVGVTFFAGTFVRHPLALAATKAVLTHLKQQGPALQQGLNERTAALAGRLDRFFAERGVPSRVHSFCSWFYFTFPHDARLASLLYYAMRSKGIHIQEGYPCFLTTAHSDADLAAVEAAFCETIVEMQAAGVMPCDLPVERRHALAMPATHEPLRVPLTEPQREIFLAAALNDEANCAFNESLTLTLRGTVRAADLAAAMDAVLARHDALRSTVDPEGEWLQVAATQTARTELRDLRGMDAISAGAAVVAAVASEAATPFDLVYGPLVRATCFLVAADCAVVVLTAHHLVLDGWSANQMLEEVGRIYNGGARAELSALLPFSSYAVLEARRAEAGEFAANQAFWVTKFAGRHPRLELPVDRPRGLVKSYRGGSHAGRLTPQLYAEMKRASARAGCTLYVMLLAGFEALLHRLTGQREVVVGISTAGQALYEGASLVGHCVHFLPMLSETTEGVTVQEHLRATKTALLDAYDHQEFTYGTLLRKLKLEREPGRLPLIEVQFNLEKVGSNVALDGLAVRIEANAKRYVNTDLFLNIVETGETLEYSCDFNSDLFDESTIARWLGAWAVLLDGMAASPQTNLALLPLLTEPERAGLAAWNETAMDFGAFESVPACLLRRAQHEPARVALECGDITWTYAQLADYAQRLAARLVAAGLQPGGLVGLCVERSPEMLGAVLAVMIAGGAYVPLDPRHPIDRLNLVLADAGVCLLIAPPHLALATDAPRIDLAQSTVDAPLAPFDLTATDLAYVIYTSGSTGVPKGVAVEHGALFNLLRSMAREPGLNEDDVLVAITTLAFDIAGLELLLPLATGAKLVIATDAEVQDGRLLLARMESVRATVLQATPGAWRLLLDAGWAESRTLGARTLKALCGGEALPRELAERMLLSARQVWNVYGPTETTIWSSATRVEPGEGTLRLGRPIANTQFYVLDEHREQLPIGVTGELFIGGAGLARGYWQRDALTAEKFIANPLKGEPSPRLYATGDLARRHADGSLELLGRIDFQVKLRGFRIELQEIEAALLQHPLVQDAVVVYQQAAQAAGSGALVGYVATRDAAHDAAAGLPAQLAAQLARILPDYMVPSRIAVLKALPRTANGKLDRKALPQTFAEQPADTPRSFTAPANAAEAALARIWAEVLELPAVSTTESIFELGADSLLIFRIAARAQREGYALNATQIFQHRTVAGVCAVLNQHAGDTPIKVTTRITAASRDKYKLNGASLSSQSKVDA